MFKPVITYIIQHLIAQNSWAKPHLIPFAGNSICLDFKIVKTTLTILEDGSLCHAGETTIADASMTISPSLMIRLLANDPSAKQAITVSGDIPLAKAVSRVLQEMQWDMEDDLSLIVGDIAAYRINQLRKQTMQTVKKQSINSAEIVTEFLQEEKMLLSKGRHLEQFNQAVDALNSDVDRFEQQVKQLQQDITRLGLTNHEH